MRGYLSTAAGATVLVAVSALALALGILHDMMKGDDVDRRTAAQPAPTSPTPAALHPRACPRIRTHGSLGGMCPTRGEAPAFNQVMNGIAVGPSAKPRGGPCTPGGTSLEATSAAL